MWCELDCSSELTARLRAIDSAGHHDGISTTCTRTYVEGSIILCCHHDLTCGSLVCAHVPMMAQ